MTRALYRFRVDWDGDYRFAHANSDLTQNVWSLQCRRGKEGEATFTNRSVGGVLDASLYNPGGLLSSFQATSTLYGLIRPRRKVQFQMRLDAGDDWTDLWTGWLVTIIPEAPVQQLPRARLLAHGSLALLNADTSRVANQLSIKTGAAYDLVLDAANWPNHYDETILADSPAGYWRLGESSGDAIDSSGNGNNGTVTGATQGAAGLLVDRADTAYSFDGASGNVNIGNPAILNDTIQGFEAVIQADSDGEGNEARIFQKNGTAVYVSGESAGAMYLNFTRAFSVTDGIWTTVNRVIVVGQTHHICVMHDRTTSPPVIYVDGAAQTVAEAVTPSGSPTSDAGDALVIGNAPSDTVTFDGKIEEAAVYDTVLTAAQVQAHYRAFIQRWRDIDPGNTTMTRWWADSHALHALRKLDDTEKGYTREGRDGAVVFEDRLRRLQAPHTTSQATYTDEGATIRYRNIAQADPFEDVYKTFRAQVTSHTTATLAVLWTVVGEPSIAPGQSIDLWAEVPNQASQPEVVGVAAWTTPVAGTDYIFHDQPGGSGNVVSGDIGLATSEFFNAMKMRFTNNGLVTAYMSTGQARGQALEQQDTVSVAHEAANSPVDSEWPNPAEFIPTVNEADGYVRCMALVHGQANPVLTIGYNANAGAAFLADARDREVSDRVTVKSDAATDMGIGEDFFIETITHDLDRHGKHDVTLELSSARIVQPFWALGVGQLGVNTALMYSGS